MTEKVMWKECVSVEGEDRVKVNLCPIVHSSKCHKSIPKKAIVQTFHVGSRSPCTWAIYSFPGMLAGSWLGSQGEVASQALQHEMLACQVVASPFVPQCLHCRVLASCGSIRNNNSYVLGPLKCRWENAKSIIHLCAFSSTLMKLALLLLTFSLRADVFLVSACVASQAGWQDVHRVLWVLPLLRMGFVNAEVRLFNEQQYLGLCFSSACLSQKEALCLLVAVVS